MRLTILTATLIASCVTALPVTTSCPAATSPLHAPATLAAGLLRDTVWLALRSITQPFTNQKRYEYAARNVLVQVSPAMATASSALATDDVDARRIQYASSLNQLQQHYNSVMRTFEAELPSCPALSVPNGLPEYRKSKVVLNAKPESGVAHKEGVVPLTCSVELVASLKHTMDSIEQLMTAMDTTDFCEQR